MEFRVYQVEIGIRKIRIQPIENLRTSAQLIRLEKRIVAFPLRYQALKGISRLHEEQTMLSVLRRSGPGRAAPGRPS